MLKGTCRWFGPLGMGYGFIRDTDGNDVYVNFRVIQRDGQYRALIEGEPVQYEVEQGERCLRATVVIPDDPRPIPPPDGWQRYPTPA